MKTNALKARATKTCGAFTAALAATAMLAACTNSSDRMDAGGDAEGVITWYTTIQAEDAQPLMDAFTEKTGLTVNLYTAGTPTVWERLQAENSSGRNVADVLSLTSAQITQEASEKGYLAPLPESITSDYPEEYVDPAGEWFAMRVTVYGMIYNPTVVTGEDIPTSWTDMLDPQFKDTMIMSDSTVSTGGYAVNWQLGHSPAPLGAEFLTEFAAQQPFLDSHSGTIVNEVIAGSRRLGITADDAVWSQKETGAPVEMVYPTEGAANIHDYTTILKDAPNMAAAEQFASFLASSEGQTLIAQTGSYVVRPDVQPVPADRPPLDSIKLLDPQTDAAAAGKDAFLAELVTLGLATKA